MGREAHRQTARHRRDDIAEMTSPSPSPILGSVGPGLDLDQFLPSLCLAYFMLRLPVYVWRATTARTRKGGRPADVYNIQSVSQATHAVCRGGRRKRATAAALPWQMQDAPSGVRDHDRVVLDTHSLANETLTGTPFFVIRTPPPPHCHVSPRRPCGGEDPLPLPGKCRRGGMGSHPCAWTTTTTTTNRRGPSVRAQGEARRRGDGQPVQR